MTKDWTLDLLVSGSMLELVAPAGVYWYEKREIMVKGKESEGSLH